MSKISKTGTCIRKKVNFLFQDKNHKIDKDNFDIKSFESNLNITSPKALELLKNIEILDKNDMKNYNKKFKHIIYTDLRDSSAGSKMIAASMMTKKFKNVYDKTLKINETEIKKNKDNNFALLSSVQIYNKPFPVKLKKHIIELFNNRDNNINGNVIRFIILDSGYKEGIDLFDVKYVHLFEPLITNSDEKQAIGRGTRFCGQKGLKFHPTLGWPLHVYKYNLVNIDKKIDYHQLFLDNSDLDLKKLIFAKELENISKYGAVDYNLNINLHKYKEINTDLYNGYKLLDNNTNNLVDKVKNPLLNGGGIKGKRKQDLNFNLIKSPRKIYDFMEMRDYIKDRFMKFKWDDIKFENNCEEKKLIIKSINKKYKSLGGDSKSVPLPEKNKPPSLAPKDERLITLTPTQNFVSHFFDNSSAYKGLLLWHSVGTGKTCSAISVATKGFEEHGYTILWVTRHTLKSDIWKNMFKQVCSSVIRRKIINNENIPKNITKNYLKYLSDSWIMPISYKQFSNLLQQKNSIYKILKKRNGDDILKKTLVIIDEAHKLYSSDLKTSERPNIEIMKNKIDYSYKHSGKDSVKLLLLTATPYTTDPIHLINLINLMKEKDKLPEDFSEFTREFLDETGKFTEKGSKKYLDSISGYISYLNRENDVRNFAYPVLYNVNVEASKKLGDIKQIEDELDKENEKLEKNNEKLEKADKKDKKAIKEDIKINKKVIKEIKKEMKKLEKNDISQETLIEKCLKKK